MEFNEKLQQLRKKQGMTQEQLSEKLYISRTAVSKWESGRGFPNIEALKNISRVFQVPIDELLSGEELLDLAEHDSTAKLNKAYTLIFGLLDIFVIMFIFFPLYGKREGDYVRAVNLLNHTDISNIRIIYFIVLIALGGIGFVEVIIHFAAGAKLHRTGRICSVFLHSLAILFFASAREPYATSFLFTLLLSKIGMLLRKSRDK